MPESFHQKLLKVMGSPSDLPSWREHVLQALLTLMLGLGALVALPSMALAWDRALYPVLLLDVLALLLVAGLRQSTHLSMRLRAGSLLVLVHLLGTALLWWVGLVGQAYLMTVPVLAILLLSGRAALMSLLANVLTWLFLGLAAFQGYGVLHLNLEDPAAFTVIALNTLLADVLTRALARAHRNGTEVAVLFIDLDGFKPINDAHGHACGDEALQQVAQRLTSAIRHADTVARIGGDEFVILLSDLPAGDRAGVQHVADKCLGTFAQPFRAKGQTCRLGASVGIAMGHGDTPPDTLLSAADTAMYSAKQAGKGQVVWAAPDNVPTSA